MNNKKNKITNLTMTIIIIILLILIIYLLLSKNENEKLKPSGNVDIFEINCNIDCKCDKDESIDDSIPVFDETDFKENFTVSDSNLSWQSTNNLNIFSNPMYEMENKIAPNSTNFYQFVVRNNTIYDVQYNIFFNEINEQKINMKYRLIKKDDYVAGNENKWVTYNELNLKEILLTSKNSDTYYLEWKWIDSENDTQIGEAGNVNYSLSIDIKAVQVQ